MSINQVRFIAKLRHPNLVRIRGFYWGSDERLILYDYVSNGSLTNVFYNKIFLYFLKLVRFIAKLRHPNLVRIRGFYWSSNERLILYDYVSNGSLTNGFYNKIFLYLLKLNEAIIHTIFKWLLNSGFGFSFTVQFSELRHPLYSQLSYWEWNRACSFEKEKKISMKKTKSSNPSHAREKAEGESTCRTSSSSIVSSNEDLMVNILSRLPVKVLSRFRCVCKRWNMLISDPYFVSTHQGRAIQDPNIMKLLCELKQDGLIRVCSIEEKEERKVTHDLIQPNYPDRILWEHCYAHMVGRPCNGLICLEGSHFALVCNPATRNTLVIPRGEEEQYYYLEGLGFCSSSNQFKLVRLYEISTGYRCDLFTIGQRGARETHPLQPICSWRHVGDFPYHICRSGRYMCHVNGRVHWIIWPLLDSSSEYVLSLDLELEAFKVVSCPEHWPEEARDEYVDLMELRGELGVVFLDWDVWEIWVLKDYTNSIWSKEYQINENIPGYPLFKNLRVLGIRRGRLLLIINDGIFCYYDPRNNSLEVIFDESPYLYSWFVTTYVENLVIPF
ncbi:hypothetical protein NE237_006528 [Protea cynaroides]|uniref:F-box domain-containing protein n=1 Tax=Protea cynaroides TaxID=273540 RepID=A0A9Q0KMS5_9MAGN|nr:hypothetical protein NE237_006528 [Protea cynaroides]